MATPQRIYVPKIRQGQTVVKCDRTLFAWGGLPPHGVTYTRCDDVKKFDISNTIDVYNHLTNKWKKSQTNGQPPLGVYKYASSSLNNNKIIYFGGHCGHDQCYHNSLYELSIDDYSWNEILPTDNDIISKKIECGLYCFTLSDGNDYALIVGGKLFENEAGTSRNKKESVFTKECHIVNLNTGQVVLNVEGPLSADFQFVPMDNDSAPDTNDKRRAIAYGGDYSDGIHKDLHIAEIEITTSGKIELKWTTVYARRNSIQTWPRRRHHYAVCSLPKWNSLLLLSGCEKKDGKCLRECWIYNYMSRQWTNIGFPDQLVERMGHSVVAWAISPTCIRVAVIGGTTANGEMTQQQFGAFEIYLLNKGKQETSDAININEANDYLVELTGIDNLKKTIEDIQKNWEQKQIELEYDMEALERDQEELEHEKKELLHERKELEKEKHELEHEEEELQHKTEEIIHQREEIEKEKHQLEEELEHKREDLQHEEEVLEKGKHKFEEELQHKTEEIVHEREELEKEKHQLEEEMQHKREDLEHEKEELEKEKHKLEHIENIKHQEDEFLKLKQNEEQLQQEKEKLEREKLEIEQEKKELAHEREDLTQQKEEFKKDKEKLNHERQDLEREKKQLEKEIKHEHETLIKEKEIEINLVKTLKLKQEELENKKQELEVQEALPKHELQREKDALMKQKEKLRHEEEEIMHEKDEIYYEKRNLECQKQNLQREKAKLEQEQIQLEQKRQELIEREKQYTKLTKLSSDIPPAKKEDISEDCKNVSEVTQTEDDKEILYEQNGDCRDDYDDVIEIGDLWKEIEQELDLSQQTQWKTNNKTQHVHVQVICDEIPTCKVEHKDQEVMTENEIENETSVETMEYEEEIKQQEEEMEQQEEEIEQQEEKIEQQEEIIEQQEEEVKQQEEKISPEGEKEVYIHKLEMQIAKLCREKRKTEKALALQRNTLKQERQKILENNENTKELIHLLKEKIAQKAEEIEDMKITFFKNNKALKDLMYKFDIVQQHITPTSEVN